MYVCLCKGVTDKAIAKAVAAGACSFTDVQDALGVQAYYYQVCRASWDRDARVCAHPAPFPEEIITLPILQTSKEFELVLDPFTGSGTTGRVCDKLQRSFVGYDLKGY